MLKSTVLEQAHIEAGAKLVDFGGWNMPLHYGSQLEEHRCVRQDAGMFDVSHMTVVDLLGAGGRHFLRSLLANDIDKLQHPGKALYSCMLNHRGGVIDDLIVYSRAADSYRLVLNAATHDKDMAWLQRQAEGLAVGIQERRDLAIIAVQGPNGIAKALKALTPERMDAAATLANFESADLGDWFIARTGYTGEAGFEIILPAKEAPKLWKDLLAQGVVPCGLGARDTLRLEAGMMLYGQDMDETTSPLESGLSWTVAFEPSERDFIGRAALSMQKEQGLKQKMVGLLLETRGVLRPGYPVLLDGKQVGVITSGSHSPTLGHAIALARVSREVGDSCSVEIRGKEHPVKVTPPRFLKKS